MGVFVSVSGCICVPMVPTVVTLPPHRTRATGKDSIGLIQNRLEWLEPADSAVHRWMHQIEVASSKRKAREDCREDGATLSQHIPVR
eukprot:SAG31_NODE_2835_length_5019_cov_2.618293_3_plen_87_part_00